MLDLYKRIKKIFNQNSLLELMKESLRNVDDFLVTKIRRKKFILFHGVAPNDFVIFEPIYKKLISDKRFVINFVNALDDTNFCKNFGIVKADFLKKKSVRLKKWDLYIDTDYSEPLPSLLRKTKRIYIPHGIGDKKALGIAYMVREELLKYDKVFFSGRNQYSGFITKFGIAAERIAVLSGFQKMDYLAQNNFDKNTLKTNLKIDETLPIILFAPTWGEYGALNKFGIEIINKLLSSKANILVKLHDISFCHEPWCKNKLDWREKMRFYSQHSNLFEINDRDPYPYLSIADVLISDYGSLIFEFQTLKKPTIFFSIEEHNKEVVNDIERLELLKKACITIDTPALLDDAIKKTSEDFYKNNSFKEIIRKKYFVNFGRSTEIIVNEIYRLLKID